VLGMSRKAAPGSVMPVSTTVARRRVILGALIVLSLS
jgi:hypothetical protein